MQIASAECRTWYNLSLKKVLTSHKRGGQEWYQFKGLHNRRCFFGTLKGVREWDFWSLRFKWFLCHKVSLGRGLEGWNKKLFFLMWARCSTTILSLLAYAQCPLATMFHFELAPKKSCYKFLWGPLEGVKIAFSNFSLFSLVKTWFS
jgi:hypothetical protein